MKSQCVLSMINEINSLANDRIKKELSGLNIPVLINHVPLFYILPDDGSSMEFRHLREKWQISKSSLSDILTKYEELGYVEKDATCHDKRCVHIHLTKEALILKKKFMAIEAKVLSIMVSGYSDQERVRLEQDIVSILDNMKKIQ
ncbi:MAG: winged helix DNA-binding protein [Vallitaleaceae bacterium]|jgi:DNA-binding MarR family transcriptional regulator|nr:winged helix DNA-binding protein [Vallitaleaceae bacterium]